MLVIRLARTGRNKYPTYRIVAAESARAATGRFIAVLGNYNPHTKELSLKTDDIKKHMANGAQPSNTVVKLLMREQVELPAWVKLKTKARKVTETPAAEGADTEVSASEAAAEADGTTAEETTPVADEVRVGAVAEAAATDVADDTPNIGDTETAASDEAQTESSEAAQDAAAEAAKSEA